MDIQPSNMTRPTEVLIPEQDFNLYFKQVIEDVNHYFQSKRKWYSKAPLLGKLFGLPSYFDKTNAVVEKYIPIWAQQKTYSRGKICLHVYKMLHLLINDEDFKKLNKYDQNVLLWATLFHDISKRGKPLIKANKDPAHPFKSAWQTLHYFKQIFNFLELTDKDLKEWDAAFNDGYIDVKGTQIQNHIIVPNVKKFLNEKLKGKEFEKEVILYILLHQSIPTLKGHAHKALLEPLEEEVPKYFNKKTFELFRIFLRNDSFSYLMNDLFDNKQAYGDEINENINKLLPYIKE